MKPDKPSLDLLLTNMECLDGVGVNGRGDECQAWPSLPISVVKSAGRALQILEYFDDVRCAANMVEVSRALNYPESSTSVLLRSLATLGYLNYDRFKRTYAPTSRVRLLGSWVESELFGDNAVVRLMNRVNSECGDTVILASRNGLVAQYIHVVQARTALRLHITIGTERSLVNSAVGYVLLSSMSDDEVGKLIRRINSEAKNPDDVTRYSDVMSNIENVRQNGYAMIESKITAGTAIIAKALPVEYTKASLVIAIGGPTHRIMARERELTDILTKSFADELGV